MEFCNKKKYGKDPTKCLRKIVEAFLEDDQNSRLCAGKKEFVTKKKMKKQKRYLSDSLRNLHKQFVNSKNIKISYSLFCRFRPFWVVIPKIADRDTCLCVLHSNAELILNALYHAKILPFSNYRNMLLHICCDRFNEKCLMRTCELCKLKNLPYKEFDNSKKISYKQWMSSAENFIDKRSEKVRRVVKQKQQCLHSSPRDLILKLENDLPKLITHEWNIVHQYNAISTMKKTLTEKDAIIHMDFSENYCTKYHEEIQAFHFGGSRMQITLHTVVVYLQGSVVKPFCTISPNLSHNVAAIWAHLDPVLKTLPSSVENIHFLSDGPVTQYRNKMMFYVLACKLVELYPDIIYFSWNYHEAGHGKGAPDGIGAVCKRTADNFIATGGDISDFEDFSNVLRTRCPGITVYTVTDLDISKMNLQLFSQQTHFIPFKGTLKVHQIVGTVFAPERIMMKSLTCFCQSNGCVEGCTHFKLGTIQYPPRAERLAVESVFTDSE